MRNRVLSLIVVLMLALGVGIGLRRQRPVESTEEVADRPRKPETAVPSAGGPPTEPETSDSQQVRIWKPPPPAGKLHVAGRVLTHDGVPEGGCKVSLRLMSDPWVKLDAVTDTAGLFRLDGAPASSGVLLAGDTLRETAGVAQCRIDLTNGESLDGCELRLPPFRIVTVKVVDSRDFPLAGARIGMPHENTMDRGPEAPWDATDEFGAVQLRVFSKRPGIEVMRAPPNGRRYILPPPAFPGDLSSELRFVLEDAGTATGVAMTPRGQTWRGGRIATIRGKWPISITTTDSDGCFEATVPANEEVTLQAYFEDEEPLLREPGDEAPVGVTGSLLGVRAGDRDLVLQLRVEPRDRALSVKVLSPAGGPVVGATVRFFDRSEDPLSQGVTNAVGLAAIQGLPARNLMVEVSPPNGDPAAADWTKSIVRNVVPEGQELIIRLRPGFRISGVVLKPDGEPCAGAMVSTLIRRPDFGLVTVGSDGRFSLLFDSEDVDRLDLVAMAEVDGRILNAELKLRDRSVREVTIRLKEKE